MSGSALRYLRRWRRRTFATKADVEWAVLGVLLVVAIGGLLAVVHSYAA